jgi:hypothetical protein
MGGVGGGQNKNTPLGFTLKNFKNGFNGDYRVRVTPSKHKTFCEIDWPVFSVGWPLEGSLDKVIVNRVFEDTQISFPMLIVGRMQSSAHIAKALSREST